ncbi:hypothetical protein VaNZ11_011150, partial [Volvox africanus]
LNNPPTVNLRQPPTLTAVSITDHRSQQIATELLDDGLLTSGLLPAVRHAATAGLITRDAIVVPAAATVWLQAAELSVPPPIKTGGLDLREMDRYRWWPSHSLGAPMAEGAYEPLSDPKEAWHFD